MIPPGDMVQDICMAQQVGRGQDKINMPFSLMHVVLMRPALGIFMAREDGQGREGADGTEAPSRQMQGESQGAVRAARARGDAADMLCKCWDMKQLGVCIGANDDVLGVKYLGTPASVSLMAVRASSKRSKP